MMHWDALVGTWALLVSYGRFALPLSYLYSFAFDGPSAAQISIAGVNFLTGFGFVVAYAVLVRRDGRAEEALDEEPRLESSRRHIWLLV